MGIKKWNFADIDNKAASKLAVQSGLEPLVCDILAGRGFDTLEKLEGFFADELYSPFLLPDMQKAADRVQKAVDEQESICVYGDYDCDGITSTVLLYTYLQNMGAVVSYYIPDRDGEGYGMNNTAVDTLAQRGVGLIITVDNGSSAIEEIAYANSLGMQVVVTDHHKLRDTLPDAVAVVNPHRSDCEAPFKELAGVGVVFKLICAMEGGGGVELLDYYGDLTCIGTVADIVPLTSENRTIVRYGLERLQFTDNAGIRALMEIAGVGGDKPLSCENIAFMLAPRINAAGRMGCTEKAVELLLCEDEGEAAELAGFINEQNKARQGIEAKITEEVSGKITADPRLLDERLLVLSGEGWHHGIIGIVCSKITERYGKPCLLISTEGGEARGSGRSIEGFSLIQAVSKCAGVLTRYGGHNMAAGFSLEAARVKDFKAQLLSGAAEDFAVMPLPCVRVDKELAPKEISIENMKKLKVLEPFGAGNEAPIFAVTGVKIEAIYPMGADGGHLRLRLNKGGESFYAVYFGMSAANFSYSVGDIVDIAAGCDVSVYNGDERVTVKIKALRPSGIDYSVLFASMGDYGLYRSGKACPKEDIPTRDDIAVVYRFLRGAGGFCGDAVLLFVRLGGGISYCKLMLALDVMGEMGLIKYSAGCAGISVSLCNVSGKIELQNSKILRALGAAV